MLRIVNEVSLKDFRAWGGALWTLDTVIAQGKCEDLEEILDELYPGGITSTALNDILWFESNWVFKVLNLNQFVEVE